jgi:hypothetical protein
MLKEKYHLFNSMQILYQIDMIINFNKNIIFVNKGFNLIILYTIKAMGKFLDMK